MTKELKSSLLTCLSVNRSSARGASGLRSKTATGAPAMVAMTAELFAKLRDYCVRYQSYWSGMLAATTRMV